MKISDCTRENIIRKHISIRVDNDLSKWLSKHNLSPTLIFNEACKELGYKRGKKR